jgi:hypothetical protein
MICVLAGRSLAMLFRDCQGGCLEAVTKYTHITVLLGVAGRLLSRQLLNIAISLCYITVSMLLKKTTIFCDIEVGRAPAV